MDKLFNIESREMAWYCIVAVHDNSIHGYYIKIGYDHYKIWYDEINNV